MNPNGVNLIRRKVQIEESVQNEKDWYALFNVLIICLVVSLAIVTSLFRMSLKADLEEKQSALATNINTNLNTITKESVKQKISTLEDKYSIYTDFKNQNIDVNKIHDEISKIYPNIKIDKFSIRPDSDFIDISFHISEKGYIELPNFFNALKTNPSFENAEVKSVSFSLKDNNSENTANLVDNLNASESFVAQVRLSLDKTALIGTSTNSETNN